MERDEDIAAQKQAARMRLAELEGADDSGASFAAASKAAASKKGFGEPSDGADAGVPGSVHRSLIPERPRGLAGRLAPTAAAAAYAGTTGWGEAAHHAFAAQGKQYGSKADLLGFIGSGIGLSSMRQARFLQLMLAGLVLCLALPSLGWASRTGWGAAARAALPHTLGSKLLLELGGQLYVPATAALLLYCLGAAATLRPGLLHFESPELEGRYLLWSNQGKLVVDSMFQAVFMLVGLCLWFQVKHSASAAGNEDAISRSLFALLSIMGSNAPVLLLLLLRSPSYVAWREQLLAGSRLASIAALSLLQLSLPASCAFIQLPLSLPFVALAQLTGIVCMQVRLATFVPFQVLHLLVLLAKTQAASPALHFAQLFGGGLCLPCLLLYSMESYSRKAFLATVVAPAPAPGPKKHV